MTDVQFFTQIPAWVDELDDITDFQARLLGYIYTLENTTGVAFPKNETIAKRFHKSKDTVKKALSALYSQGYVHSQLVYADDGKTVTKRFLKVGAQGTRGGVTDYPTLGEYNTPGGVTDYPESKSINKSINKSKSKDILSGSKEPDPILYQEIVDYLNSKTGKKFKHNTDANKRLIKARWQEGFALDDFKTVVDKKVASWSDDKMKQYLRPATLFGTKFESYLNEEVVVQQDNYSQDVWAAEEARFEAERKARYGE